MTDNARWAAALDGLTRIAFDPSESCRRQRLAQAALDEATRGSGAAAPMQIAASGPVTLGSHRGGSAMASDALYDGWGSE
jgi:hypothetical protein